MFREKERASPAGAGEAFKDDNAAWGATAHHPNPTPEEARKAKGHAARNTWAFVDDVLDFEVEIDVDLGSASEMHTGLESGSESAQGEGGGESEGGRGGSGEGEG